MLALKTLAVLATSAVIGCTVVPMGTAHRSCELLQIAATEAELAPAWHLEAGEVLERCGQPDARAAAARRACWADVRNGYRAAAECEGMDL